MSFDYPSSAISNKFLFCQDACLCLTLHPYITASKQAAKNVFSGKDPSILVLCTIEEGVANTYISHADGTWLNELTT